MCLPYVYGDWITGRMIILLLILYVSLKSGHSQFNVSFPLNHRNVKCRDADEFLCRCSDVCIPRSKWQDGNIDCPDGTDEECLEYQYDCKFGKPRCISLYNFMDGVIDCASGFDEGCPAHFFVCADHSDCIDPRKYLDGNRDCADGSDEPCSPTSLLCRDGTKCISSTKFQDGVNDCPDGSDEECTLFQFECFCGKIRCIDVRRYNDSKTDCDDGSDEPSNVERLFNAGRCPDGSPLRIESLKNRTTTPPGAPMVPCRPEDSVKCRGDLDEICLIIAGAPRCTCRAGFIRPPGSSKCLHSPMLPFSHRPPDASWTTAAHVPLFIFTPAATAAFSPPRTTSSDEKPQKSTVVQYNRDGEPSTRLPVLKFDKNDSNAGVDFSKVNCSLDDPSTCPALNEVCAKTRNVLGCVCDAGFSRQPATGICSKMEDECGDETLNDCDPNAICMDNPLSYECLCREGYLDMSAQPHTTPGRHCIPLINECLDPRVHDCDSNAECIDLPKGFTCSCKAGFSDVSRNPNKQPGRKCTQEKNECSRKEDNECSPFATCADLTNGYRCRCNDGFIDVSTNNRTGTICRQIVNECLNSSLNDCDPQNSDCTDTLDSYVCRCKSQFLDQDPSKPGRKCLQYSTNNPCLDTSLNDCDPNALCSSSSPGQYECTCPSGFVDISPNNRKNGKFCRQLVDECTLGTHRCDPNALCSDSPESYSCKCPDGWKDISPDKEKNSGRQCEKAENPCSRNNCSPNAVCQAKEGGGYSCQCKEKFFDSFSNENREPGRQCKELKNECQDRTADCAKDAVCIDTPESYLCRCKDSYSDESPDPVNRPGRKCVKNIEPKPVAECDVNDPLACHKDLFEVCTFMNGTYRCLCPKDVSRLPDGRCKVVNECSEARLNDCHQQARCIDTADSYVCQCKPGFADLSEDTISRPARRCQELINECNDIKKYNVDCDQSAVCIDTESSFGCRCKAGFADVSEKYNKLPGRKCVQAVNECLNATLNHCSPNSICEDAKEGYTCRCKEGFVDVSPNVTHYPGRICSRPPSTDNNEIGDDSSNGTTVSPSFQLEECDPKAERPCRRRGEQCEKFDDNKFVCQCAPNASRFEDGTCKVLNACDNRETNGCDQNAICSNIFDSYECQCKPQFLDISPDQDKKGRKCKELINECADPNMNDCSPSASCIDTRESFACVCRNGYVDVSAQFSMPPGRKCQNTSNECSLKTLNTCDDNADCVDTADDYTCQCAPGFVDVSASASLPPGRVCSVETYCPTQQTDLLFLVDGSGSIGSFIFKNEVLRFVQDFVTLFDVSPNQTRIGMIQFSDQIRHEFELGSHGSKEDVEKAVSQVSYLTGLTRTGAAIKDMVDTAFTEKRGARPMSSGVHRVAIVITDGRSQDNVTEPALDARRANVLIFAVGVTDHVLESELIQIAGSRERTFIVEQFTDLNTRLRSLIQKTLCPQKTPTTPTKAPGCDPNDLDACDRTRNEICARLPGGAFGCGCPAEFERHPKTGVCGGDLCNFQLRTSCPDPEICKQTFYGNFRCVCPVGYFRLLPSGVCFSNTATKPPVTPSPKYICKIDDPKSCGKNEVCVNLGGILNCQCQAGLVRHPLTNECRVPGACDPNNPTNCDSRRREVCLPDGLGNNICQCPPKFERHPVTQVCLMNECATSTHDCDKKAICTDTDEGYICQCPDGFLDDSLDPQKPGRRCRLISFSTDVCEKNNCSSDALCIPIASGYACQCKPGFVDFSPNRQRLSGLVCKKKENECINGKATCHKDATCLDTDESYICVCKPGFVDKLGLTNPGRACEPFSLNEKCNKGNNDCDPNARCIPQGANDYVCLCPPGYKDKSPNIQSRPGRLCIPLIPECDNPTLNDCDENGHCFEQEDGFTCACKADYVDISRDQNRPGRLCKKLVDECFHKMDDCALDTEGGICEDTADSYACRCRPGYADLSSDPINRPGRVCRPVRNKCVEGLHDCSPNAHCVEMGDSFTCKCGPGFFDVSTDPVNRPGRSCLRLINECETGNLNDCSPNAFCNDTIQSYICQCKSGFNDESPDLLNRPGRICRPRNVNECELNTADCSVNAECIDLDDGFRCQCRQGFIDESPNKVTLPGRICVATPPTTPKPDCRLEDINSCNVNVNEVCRMAQGQPKCVCPERFQRNPQTNACSVVDECKFFELNDCAQNSECIDELDGYTCKCKPNYKDKSPSPTRPGRVCQPMINECQFPHLNDCHQNALCTDLENGYQCKCKDGFLDMSPDPVNRPGRICHFNVDECQNPNLNSCDQNAKCVDEPFGYHCECNVGYLDISPTPTIPGRACKKIVDECLNRKDNDCDPIAKCIDTRESYRCECPANSTDISPNPAFTGRVCHIDVDVCRENLHDCDKNAICRNKGSSFICECVQNFIDRSPNPLRPGRVCIPLVNECQEGSATCSPNSECRDLEDGYTCTCKQGFVDRSPVKTQPGRVCTRPEICPSNHDCSSAAICEPNDNGGYSCRCIPGYEDQSPSDKPGRVCVRGDKCRDARLNNCSQNAVCYSLAQGYRCECVQGFLDKSPNPALPGRVCEPQAKVDVPKRHPCQDPSLNDCALTGVCRSLNENNYTCECRPGYSDRSPDPQRAPGRVCVPQPPICFDPSQNDCHPFAICEQLDDARRFSCRCRDGYVDTSPDPQKPGRICREKINECLDASKNDCAPQAICDDLDLGFKCRCPPKFRDISPDPQRPGRKCAQLIDECQNPQMNNCSRFADCIDQENGYKCQCKDGYFDNDRSLPGRQCAFIINECEFPNLNDCDKHALCSDLPGGYSCRCPEPYTDGSPDPNRFPGRICLLNECLEQRTNDCHSDSICQDTPDSYVCHCKEGFVDNSPDPRKPGRFCSKQTTTITPRRTTQANPDAIPCGRSLICQISLNERCVGGVRCECPPLTSRRAPGQPCVPVVGFQLPLRVVRREQTPLNWASAFGNPNDPRYIEITDMFDFGLAQSINTTSVAPAFISASTDAITHPRLYNASWNDGLMFNFTVYFKPNTVDNPEKVFKELMKSISSNQYEIGDSTLFIDAYQIDPFAPPPNPEPTCGNTGKSCDSGLGEVCLAGRVCACPNGKGRRELKNPCVEIVGFTLPLWVIRRNHEVFTYNKSFVDTNSPFYKNLVDTFGKGCQQAYSKTSLWNGYVNNEVRDILEPRKFNGSWDHGCVFNFTVYFEKAARLDARRCYNELVKSCQSTNYSLGGTELFINHLQQPSPFSPCFKNDCHPSSACIERGSNSYTCTCPAKYRDLDANRPGRRCIAEDEFDECANPSDNECSPNANCIDESHLYRCECKSGYIDMSPHDQGKGRICDLDYCLDVPFCPANTSCQNVPEIQGARCQCHPGYTDIKPSAKRLRLFGENVFCLATRDVNECDLELTNCSSVAVCTDTADGYRCACSPGYTDANPSLPGRVCAGASCGLCNGHGDCLPVAGSPEVKCRCHSWYTGEFCDKDIRVYLIIILAIIFLLLALCSLLYFCFKCRCIRGRQTWYKAAMGGGYGKGQQTWPWTTMHGSSSSESGAALSVTGPAKGSGGSAAEYYPDLAIPRAKLRADRNEQRRRADHLQGYLTADSDAESAIRIPRARLGNETIERNGGGSVLLADVNRPAMRAVAVPRRAGAFSDSSFADDSSSTASSDYTTHEEVERRVITDVKKTETSKTTTAQIHNATAQFRVYPPVASMGGKAAKSIYEAFSGLKKLARSSSGKKQSSKSQLSAQPNPELTGDTSSNAKDLYSTTAATEKDRGQSIAEFSVGGRRPRVGSQSSDWGETYGAYSQPRAVSEYTVGDLASISEESQYSTSTDLQQDLYDKKILLKKSHNFQPDAKGSSERFKNEVSTKIVKSGTRQL